MFYVCEMWCFQRGVIEGSGVWNVTLQSWVDGPEFSKEHVALILKGRMVPGRREAQRPISEDFFEHFICNWQEFYFWTISPLLSGVSLSL
jgi:hypothetical protein